MKKALCFMALVVLANIAHAGVLEFCATDRVTGQGYCGPIWDGGSGGEG
ncbi:hypothetical protein [Burkholderia mayonis]|nr:hypothetical protein [Burkholderia mayonis]